MIEHLASQIEAIKSDLGEVKGALREMAQAVTKLAAHEERLTSAAEDVGRLERRSDGHDQRLNAIESSLPLIRAQATRGAGWIDRVTWGLMCALAALLASKMGLVW